jgi:hypothetical protein
MDILVGGDLDPTLRAPFPAAVRSALDGDPAPLGRLREHFIETGNESSGVDTPLFFTTTCEELPFPWDPSAAPAARLAEATALFDRLPQSAFAPFDVATSLYESGVEQCDAWPGATATAPTVAPPLPNVATLILSGADDLRTPTDDARAVAAAIPDAQVVVVPNTGHSVLGSELGGCSRRAIQAFFTGQGAPACRNEPLLLAPTPIPPLHLAHVHPAHGVPGKPGRTLAAVEATLGDVLQQLGFNALATGMQPTSSFSFGGLRGGFAAFAPLNGIALHRYSYVPGVALTGSFLSHRDVVRVSGHAAAHGEVHANANGSYSGTLGGRRVHFANFLALAAASRARRAAPIWHS